jgi:hypothetical protein
MSLTPVRFAKEQQKVLREVVLAYRGSRGHHLPRGDRDLGRRLGFRSSGVGGRARGGGGGAIGPNLARMPRRS